jgi:hypothetical protein
MELPITYRGKTVTGEDVQFIRELIGAHPNDTRRVLSKKLCEAWNWVQPNGALRDMVCRGLMLQLHRSGYITLPPKKVNPNNPFVNRCTPSFLSVDTTQIRTEVNRLGSLTFKQVRRTDDESLFNSLIHEYHYLGYTHPVGEQLKYLVYAHKRPIACFSWSSAPRHIGCRDRFIGWNQETRKQNISSMAYNSRFLILPFIRIKHLASHLLGQMVKILPVDWLKIYRHPIYFVETFVDTERFRGTCYKAANWIYLGRTTGRGKDDHTYRQNRSIKAVYGYPLVKDFREKLCTKKRKG